MLLLIKQILVDCLAISAGSRFQLILQLLINFLELLHFTLHSFSLLLLIEQFCLKGLCLPFALLVQNIDIPSILLMQPLHILLPQTSLFLQIHPKTLVMQ